MMFFKRYFSEDYRISVKIISYFVVPICAAIISALLTAMIGGMIIHGGSQVFSAVIFLILILALLGLGVYLLIQSDAYLLNEAFGAILMAAGQIATMFFTYLSFAVLLYLGGQEGFMLLVFPLILVMLIFMFLFGLLLNMLNKL
jgi:hypothetical protein